MYGRFNTAFKENIEISHIFGLILIKKYTAFFKNVHIS